MNEQPVYWVGIDVAKRKFDAAVAAPGLTVSSHALRGLPAATFANTKEGLEAFLQWIRTTVSAPASSSVRVVMEATGQYSLRLAEFLHKKWAELGPAIENPQRTHAFQESLGVRNKTDRLEARALAFYGLERKPVPYKPLTPARAKLRELVRVRDDLIKSRTMHTNQLKEQTSKLCVQILRPVLKTIAKGIEETEALITDLVKTEEELCRDYALLKSIKGVGPVTAAVVLAEFGDLRLFESARQVGAHAGVTPAKNESGSLERPTRMCKKGNARVRQALYMAALSASRFNPQLRIVYQRLVNAGKEHMVAIGAIMRKLIVLMRAIIVSGTPYDPLWKKGTGRHRFELQNA